MSERSGARRPVSSGAGETLEDAVKPLACQIQAIQTIRIHLVDVDHIAVELRAICAGPSFVSLAKSVCQKHSKSLIEARREGLVFAETRLQRRARNREHDSFFLGSYCRRWGEPIHKRHFSRDRSTDQDSHVLS